MNLREFRRARLEQSVRQAGVDLLVASLPANIEYVSGYHSIPMDVLAKTQAYALFMPEKRKITMVVSIAEVPSIEEILGEDAEFYCFGTFRFETSSGCSVSRLVRNIERDRLYKTAEAALVAAILASDAKRVALDETHMSYPTWSKIAELCPHVQLIPGAAVFMQARMIKHEEEIAGLERSVEIAEAAFQAALEILRPGVTELDLEHTYNCKLAQLGARPMFFVATAAHRAAFSDTRNTSQAIQKGDMIRFDFGCVYKGYHADIARTVVMGQPDEKLAAYYGAVRMGACCAIASICPGVTTAGDIFKVAVETTRSNGIPQYERHHCGHGIGVECYDDPAIADGNPTILQPGMTLCIETPYYELGWGGVQLEDTIAVTQSGARYLDKSSQALIVLEERT